MIVLESSAVVHALVDDPVSPDVLALLADEDLHAPALLDFEVATALRGLAIGHKLSRKRMAEAVDDFMSLQIERHQMTVFLQAILDLSSNFTVYDAAYVVLAEALGAPLITVDTKLLEARRLDVDVRVFAT